MVPCKTQLWGLYFNPIIDHLRPIKPHKKKYGYLKRSYRTNGKVKTEEIYIGLDEVATKILADLATRELIDETDITYSGETILKKIADPAVLRRHFGTSF